MARLVSSKHLEGVSDLTLSAPIKQGFIHAFESVTYETRLKLLLKSLFKIRQTARQYSEIKPFVDPSERIQSLLDFRLAVLEDGEPHRLLLTATFDRPFEPYMRLIWRPLGTLLDVIFCNCEGYVTATENSFEDYLDWVRRAQIDTDFFWAMSGNSIDDHQYVLKIDRLERLRARGREPAPRNRLEQRDRRDADGQRASLKCDTPGSTADLIRRGQRDTADFLGLEALVGLYRLTEFYPPDDPEGDGELLRKAAAELLQGWATDEDDGKPHALPPAYSHQLLIGEQLAWLNKPIPRTPRHATDAEGKPRPKRQVSLPFDHGAVQGGIARPYHPEPTRQGAMLLMRITEAAKARRFIADLGITSGDPGAAAPSDGVYRSLAFTRHGLLNIGVSEADYLRLPQEFREGMEDRAGLLGDLRSEHPREWLLPKRNWPPRPGGWTEAHGRAELSEIDLVVQLRTTSDHPNDDPVGDEAHPLHAAIRRIAERPDSGVVLVAVEPMQRASNARPGDDFAPDHFGYRDGFSQPNPDPAAPAGRDKVSPGEIFLGHKTDRDKDPSPESWLLDNGTFLAVRKLRQRVRHFHEWVEETAPKHGLSTDRLFALLVGRTRDGEVLRPGAESTDNDFDYENDADGAVCPYQAHIRRTNPRVAPDDNFGRPTPRILRRGMSWGPRYVEGETQPAERGVMFMAYCGSLAEQFETIQRWVNGGNSTAIGSWLSDPLMGAPKGEVRTFQFVVPATETEAARTVTIEIDRPFVQLLWGAYLFVPSIAAIAAISQLEDDAAAVRRAAETKEAEKGERIIRRLRAMEQEGEAGRIAAAATWKACLEDFGSKDPAEKANAPAVWAAIRRNHGGALRVPYPDSTRGGEVSDVVLAASKALVMEAFQNPDGHNSMKGQMARMRQSFGEIFLGMDGGRDYDELSAINPFIYRIGQEKAFAVARNIALEWIGETLRKIQASIALPRLEIDLRRHFITPVLGRVCEKWFDIPDSKQFGEGEHVQLAGWQWTPVGERKPSCPGDFMATSRYCFYPDPAPAVQAYGQAQGKALFDAVLARFYDQRRTGFPPPGELSQEMDKLYTDKEVMAKTLIGVMTGFLPPTDGSLRWTLYEWLEEDLFWRVQRDYLAGSGTAHERAVAAIAPPLRAAMQKRPSPDMLWRTALADHRIGGVEVRTGERILIGIVSAMAEDAVEGRSDVSPVFGGMRKPAGDPNPGPLHACPAYKFAMGTMLGMLSALFDAAESGGYDIRALPAPLLVELKPRRARGAAPPVPPVARSQA